MMGSRKKKQQRICWYWVSIIQNKEELSKEKDEFQSKKKKFDEDKSISPQNLNDSLYSTQVKSKDD